MNKHNNKYRNKHSNRQVNTQILKEFALMMSWAVPLFIGVIAPWLLDIELQWWTLGLSIIFVSLYFIAPKALYFPYKGWMFFGGIIGYVNTRIILGATFLLLIIPIGFLLKISNKLQYKASRAKNRDNNTEKTNYILLDSKVSKSRLEKPF